MPLPGDTPAPALRGGTSMRLGLRAQIMVALLLAFLFSFALLGTATLRLTQANAEVEHARAERMYAGALAAALERTAPADAPATSALLDAFARRAGLRAVRITGPGDARYARGDLPDVHGSTAVLADGRRLTLWLDRPLAHSRLPLGNLLLFYVSITGLAVLVLTHIALTHLIVRPLDSLTRSSELLATGAPVRVPERGAGEVVRLAAALNDMASQLRAERESLEQRLRELERTTIELRSTQQQLIHGEKLASVGRLAAGVAHEIGNPLAAILGLVELLRAGGLSPEQTEEFLSRVQGETERINRIIRDLLDFSRRDPKDEVSAGSADLAQVVAGAVQLVRPQKESKQVEIEVDVSPDIGRVLGPEHRLTQVVLNLLLNAVDALEGRGRVRIEARPHGESECTLTVSDDGPGLPPEVLAHLFEPFTTTKPPGKGTGLGLAVCHALVEGMGGTITAGNRLEGGARFEVILKRV